MRRATVVVALLVLASGCNALGTGPDGDRTTVTPAPVPEETVTANPAATPGECLAPVPATPDSTPPGTPGATAFLPMGGGVVNGSALVGHHAETISSYSYHLRIGAGTESWVMPGAAAFTYEGVHLGLLTVRAYAVGGTLYALNGSAAGRADEARVIRQPYRPGTAIYERYARVVSGRAWLENHVGRWNYTVVGTRTWNGTRVRVLEDAGPSRIWVTPAKALVVDSTLYVDRRGLIRYVDHERTVQYRQQLDYRNVTSEWTVEIDQIGTARLHRPESFCYGVTVTETAGFGK
ncbi:MAG: hypothetical protein ABEJ40_04860 [Haloarculaceae archaeon]